MVAKLILNLSVLLFWTFGLGKKTRDRSADGRTDGQTDRQTDRRTDRQADRQTDRQTKRLRIRISLARRLSVGFTSFKNDFIVKSSIFRSRKVKNISCSPMSNLREALICCVDILNCSLIIMSRSILVCSSWKYINLFQVLLY